MRLDSRDGEKAIELENQALAMVQRGDAKAAAGKRHEGIDQYKDAWKQAREALKKS